MDTKQLERRPWLRSSAPRKIIERNPAPTTEQLQAVTTLDRDLIVSAGAGSGKTWVLAQRYIEILNQGTLPDEIVAITFTEKAAAEMKGRIRKELTKMAEQASDTTEELFWLEMKHELESAMITTIHGFCARLLREHPIELGIDPEFQIIDAMESQFLLTEIVETGVKAWIEEVDENGLIPLIFSHFPNPDMLVSILLDLYRLLRTYPITKAGVLEETRAYLDNQRTQFLHVKHKLMPLIPQLKGIVDEMITKSAGEPKAYVTKAAEWIDGVELVWNELEAWDGVYTPENTHLMDLLSQRPAATRAKGYYEVVKEIQAYIDELEPLVVSPDYLVVIEALMDRLEKLEHQYNQAKQKLRGLDFGDLEVLSARLLQAYPDVRKKWSSRLKYIAVDEFQDTNSLQKSIIQSLLSDGEVDLFVVGDPKQSIYKFRGADVTVFHDTEQEILERDGDQISLATNFRTQRGIIDYINSLFAFLMNPEEDGPTFHVQYGEPLIPFRNPPHDEACVELLPIIIEDEGEEDEAESLGWRSVEAELIAMRIQEMVSNKELRVWRALEPGEQPAEGSVHTYEGGKEIYSMPVRYRDITILFSATTHQPIYEQALQDYGIPYEIFRGRNFYGKPEVLDLLNVLKTINNPLDEVALLGFLRSSMGQIHDEALYWLTRDHTLYYAVFSLEVKPEYVEVEQWQQIMMIRNWLQNWRTLSGILPLSHVIAHIFEETGLEEILLGSPHGERRVANINKFKDLAKNWVDEKGLSLYDFMERLEMILAENVQEEEGTVFGDLGDVVQLMTIHASKGLEFPVVILPELARELARGGGFGGPSLYYEGGIGLGIQLNRGPSRRAVGDGIYDILKDIDRDQELQEERRKLYVAMTRAKDYLILVSSQKIVKNPGNELRNNWTDWIVRHLGYGQLSELQGIELEEQIMDENGRWQVKVNWSVPQAYREDQNNLTPPQPQVISTLSEADYPYLMKIGRGKEGRTFQSLSASALMDFASCPRRFYLQNYLGVDDSMFDNHHYMEDELIGHETDDELQPMIESLQTGYDERETDANTKGRLSGITLGNIVHHVLEQSPAYEAVDETIRRAGFQEGQRLDENEIKYVRPYIINYLNSAYHRAVLEGEYKEKNELPFHYLLGDQMISGVIDKLLINERGEVTILDYKTNHIVSDEQLNDLIKHYERQALLYAIVVQEVLKQPVLKFVLYFLERDLPITIEMDEEKLAIAKEEILLDIRFIQQHHSFEDYKACGEQTCLCHQFK